MAANPNRVLSVDKNVLFENAGTPQEEKEVRHHRHHRKEKQTSWGVQAPKLVIDAKDLIFGHFDRDDRPTTS